MTMQYLGSISDFIAAIATIATLAYLAVQIKHSRLSSNSTNLQNAIQDFNSINVAVGSDANLTRIVNVGVSDFDSLTEAERGQYSYIQRAFLNCYLNIFQQHKLGALSAEQWQPYAQELAFLLTQSGPREFRKVNRTYDQMFEAVEAMHLATNHLNIDFSTKAAREDPPAS